MKQNDKNEEQIRSCQKSQMGKGEKVGEGGVAPYKETPWILVVIEMSCILTV